MDDDLLAQHYPHKKGDILQKKKESCGEFNQWKITKFLIGGYKIINIASGEYDEVGDEEMEFAVPDIKRLYGHEGHDVVVTYVAHPVDDRYLYCRDCKKEIKTRFSKLPPPEKVYFL